MCDKNHSFLLSLVWSIHVVLHANVLVKLMICSTISYLELGLSPKWTRTSATLLNMQSSYVLGVGSFWKERESSRGIRPAQLIVNFST